MKRLLLVGAAALGAALFVRRAVARLRRLRLREDDRADARERSAEVDVPQHQRDPEEHGADPRAARGRARRPLTGERRAHGRVAIAEGRLTMAVVLAYVDAVPGRLYPLVATLLELAHRGHHVAVRCGIDDVERLRSLGLEAQPLRSEIERFEPDDWRARTRFGALSRGSASSASVRRFQLRDLRAGDRGRAARRPVRRRGRLGRGGRGRALRPSLGVLDRLAGSAALARRAAVRARARSTPRPPRPPARPGGEAAHARHARARDRHAHEPAPRRARAAAGRTIEDVYLAASVVLAYTAEPFEYPRSDWPAKLTLVGPGLWEPPAEPPAWLDELRQPLVARHLLDALPERPPPGRGRVRCASRASHSTSSSRPPTSTPPACGAPANVRRRALPPAHAAARARGLRRLPRRHGDHAEGARARRPGRRSAVRTRPARGRPPRRGRTRRRPAAGTEAHADRLRDAVRRASSCDRAPSGSPQRSLRRRPGGRCGRDRTPRGRRAARRRCIARVAVGGGCCGAPARGAMKRASVAQLRSQFRT